MSTTAIHIIQLVKSLPPAERQAVTAALASLTPAAQDAASAGSVTLTQADYEGLPDDDPFFKVMEEIERERHVQAGRPAPDLD